MLETISLSTSTVFEWMNYNSISYKVQYSGFTQCLYDLNYYYLHIRLNEGSGIALQLQCLKCKVTCHQFGLRGGVNQVWLLETRPVPGLLSGAGASASADTR